MMPAHQANRRRSDGFAGKAEGFHLFRRDGVLQTRRVYAQFMA